MSNESRSDCPLRRRPEPAKTSPRERTPSPVAVPPVTRAVLVAARRTAADVAFASAYEAHSE
jgi:hypothetical protein